ncbi:DUF6538 domain-containing protein [Devosia alba]|uniref:DUF6538 domain-containing protein n=1 Tax=Devosia alba TaxID=3152360 RepID=UPI003264D828
MGLRMPMPYRHKDSGIFWMRLRVPGDIAKLGGKKEEKFSLGTRDPDVAKSAFLREMARLETRWRSIRAGTATISHKEAVAIAGEFYRDLVAANEDDPGDRDIALSRLLLDQVAAQHPRVRVIGSGNPALTSAMLERIGNQNQDALRRYLDGRGEIVDPESFGRILQAVNKGMAQGREQVLRFAEGDYRQDPEANRFPERKAPATELPSATQGPDHFLLTDVYERYADESEQAPATRKKWAAIIATVAETHPDIRTITPEWCVAWKDSLVARKLAPRTVKFGYLAALRSTCDWARRNLIIATNPADGIGLKVKKTPQALQMRGYEDDEAGIVLRLTLEPVTQRLSEHQIAARRWIPWICCYSGARVGEIAQLRKEDVKVKDGVPLLWITPEAGSVKDGNPRNVAIHSHLLEQGFLEFVANSKPGPLFYNPVRARSGSAMNPQYKKVGERIAAWVRANGITDEKLAPNHAWRHRFKTLCREHGVDPGTRDYIQGQVPHNEAEKYGKFKPGALRREIEKLPRLEINNSAADV